LNTEQASAKEAERLEVEIRKATSELLSARQASGHGLLDAQINMIVEGTGWTEAKVRVGLLLLAAFVMQLGSGFGVALGVAPLQAYLEQRKSRRLGKPDPGGHLRWRAEPGVRGEEVLEAIDTGPETGKKVNGKGSRRRKPGGRPIH
jgi:hypothetical protein